MSYGWSAVGRAMVLGNPDAGIPSLLDNEDWIPAIHQPEHGGNKDVAPVAMVPPRVEDIVELK